MLPSLEEIPEVGLKGILWRFIGVPILYISAFDEFVLDQVNSARVIHTVNQKCKLTIALKSIAAVEAQWKDTVNKACKAESMAISVTLT